MFKSMSFAPLSGTTSFTFIVPSVIVPVLSKQSTLTLANISIEYISFTSVFFVPSLITPTASVILVNKYIPEGIIATSEPAIERTLSSNVEP